MFQEVVAVAYGDSIVLAGQDLHSIVRPFSTRVGEAGEALLTLDHQGADATPSQVITCPKQLIRC